MCNKLNAPLPEVTVVGAGLAGSEAAWILAEAGVNVDLYEMRPIVKTEAHRRSEERRVGKECRSRWSPYH